MKCLKSVWEIFEKHSKQPKKLSSLGVLFSLTSFSFYANKLLTGWSQTQLIENEKCLLLCWDQLYVLFISVLKLPGGPTITWVYKRCQSNRHMLSYMSHILALGEQASLCQTRPLSLYFRLSHPAEVCEIWFLDAISSLSTYPCQWASHW